MSYHWHHYSGTDLPIPTPFRVQQTSHVSMLRSILPYLFPQTDTSPPAINRNHPATAATSTGSSSVRSPNCPTATKPSLTPWIRQLSKASPLSTPSWSTFWIRSNRRRGRGGAWFLAKGRNKASVTFEVLQRIESANGVFLLWSKL